MDISIPSFLLQKTKLFIVLFLVGIVLHFNGVTIEGVVMASFVFSIISFLFIWFGQRLTQKVSLLNVLAVLVIGIFLAFYLIVLFIPASVLCSDLNQDHFRTNILTNQCEFAGANDAECPGGDPWYYEQGCAEEAKPAALEKAG